MAVLIMSEGELARAEILRDLDEDRLTIEAAEHLLGLDRRQVFRVLSAYRSQGAQGLIFKKRGRPSNRKMSGETRAEAFEIVRQNYAVFGPTLAAEKPASRPPRPPANSGTVARRLIAKRRRLTCAEKPELLATTPLTTRSSSELLS